MYQSYNLSHTDAMKIISAIQAELDKENKGAAVAVADSHGELIALLRTDGCRLSSINIAINKAFTAAREQKESKTMAVTTPVTDVWAGLGLGSDVAAALEGSGGKKKHR